MATSETSKSIRASPFETDGSDNPFVTRHGAPYFEYYRQDPRRAARFASAMAGIGKSMP